MGGASCNLVTGGSAGEPGARGSGLQQPHLDLVPCAIVN